MRELIGLLAVIAVIAIIVYLRRQSAKAAEQRKLDDFRAMQAKADAASRAELAASAARTAAPSRSSGGILQQAADTASGKQYETATGALDAKTAELAQAREDAERAADRLSSRAQQALAAVQASAAAHGGAVPGDGTPACPSGYPVKGNMLSRQYLEQGDLAYDRTVPEVCFQSVAAAEAAGFAAALDDAVMGGGDSAAGVVVAEEVEVIEVMGERGRMGMVAEVAAVEGVVVSDDGERVDVVAEAIAASDAGGVPPGAVRGDGSRECPSAYAIKGNAESMLYHQPGSPTYASTIPEFCFASAESATAAGYSATRG